jgi:CxxC-x17-CxxC domain-containing protein
MAGFFRDNKAGFRDGPRNGFRRNSFNRGFKREMHKAVCAECKQECEVPFKPRGDRPVYCLDCFKKKKGVETTEPIKKNEEVEEADEDVSEEEMDEETTEEEEK